MPVTQANWPVSVSCSLGADALLFVGMQGREAMSDLSEYRLELFSERADLDVDAVLATAMAVAVALPGGGKRYFHGYVTEFAATGAQGRFYGYRATVRPWLWFLTLAADCRIFQEKQALDIVKAVLAPYALADIDTSALKGNYPVLPYCVQFRETDFDFISRLLAREGIYYFFRSKADRHTMVLADSFGAHQAAPGYASLRFQPGEGTGQMQDEVIYAWSNRAVVASGAQTLLDFDFEKPAAKLQVRAAAPQRHAQSKLELVDYPGYFLARARGEQLAGNRIESLHARRLEAQAGTRALGLAPGGLFTLSEHPQRAQNREFLIVAAHYAMASAGAQGQGGGGAPAMDCQLSVIDKQQEYRPAMPASRGGPAGPQSAIVVGKAGEEIWTDKYGRVKVQFHWDRNGGDDEHSSCWIRVAQGWAGRRWGSQFLPRIGQEVIVSFLDGDLDRPLVTGSLYNADNMPPYALPDQATRSGIKSNSVPGGPGYNEIRFEDKKDGEDFHVEAARDFHRVVHNNDTLKVGFETKDKGDQQIAIKNDQGLEVGHDQTVTIKNDQKLSVGHDQKVAVKNDQGLEVGGGQRVAIKKDQQLDVGGDLKLSVGGAQQSKAKSMVLEASTSIELKVGDSSIKIEPGKITIDAKQVQIKAVSAAIKSSGMMEIGASAILTISGKPVKIN